MDTFPRSMRVVACALPLLALVWCDSSSSTDLFADSPDAGGDEGGAADDGAQPEAAPASLDGCASPPSSIDCDPALGACPEVAIAGDPRVSTRGWQGYADPSLARDPATSGRLWLAYSFLAPQVLAMPDGGSAYAGGVEAHLARSDNGGSTFDAAGVLFAAPRIPDPGGSGQVGEWSSEVPSIVAATIDGQTTWFGSRMRYFLPPLNGYQPNFFKTFTIRVMSARADSPAALATAPDVGLGLTTTDAAYGVDVRLPSLGPDVAACGMLNNPALHYFGGKLYLATECIAYLPGGATNFAASKIVVFAATPKGDVKSWTWRYVGAFADQALAGALGAERLSEPEIDVARDGKLVALVTPEKSGGLTDGCIALELASLDPPVVARDCTGAPIVRAIEHGPSTASFHTGACTYDAKSSTGLMTVSLTNPTGVFSPVLSRTGVKP